MHFKKNPDAKLTETHIIHKDEEIVFLCATFQNVRLNQPDKLFDPINDFIATLSGTEQDNIFNCYKKIARVLSRESGYTIASRLDAVKAIMGELFSLIHESDLIVFINNYQNNIYIPEDLPEDTGNYIPDKTYIRSEYPDLVAFILAVQFAMPIWANLTDLVKKKESNGHKEMYSWDMLIGTPVRDMAGCKRFTRLIQVLTDSVKAPLSTLTEGIGSYDLPRWMLSMAVLRKLSIAELTCTDTKIINNVFNYVTYCIKKLPNYAGNNFQDKLASCSRQANRNDQEGDNKALLEEYKPKTAIRMAVPAETENYIENITAVVNNLVASEGLGEWEDVETKSPLYRQAIKNIRYLNHKPNHEHSQYSYAVITKLFAPQISPHAILDVSDKHLNILLGIAQAWLVERGFLHLAVQLTALEEVYDNQTQVRTNLTLTKVLEAQLLEESFWIKHSRKDTSNRNTNVGLKDVHTTMAYVSSRYWVCNVRPEYLELIKATENYSRITLSPELKKDYAKFYLATTVLNYYEV